MKTADFKAALTSNGQIEVPPEIASQVPPGAQVQVILGWELSPDEVAWRAVGKRRFEAAYSPEDSIYDELIDDPSTR
jgi:hypothetical protein